MRKLLSILILFCIISCNNSSVDVMDLAESLMAVQPDSALALLNSFPKEELNNQEENARFALLYSQALVKNKIFVKDDSIIKIAVNYYQNANNNRYKMLSYFYYSQILYNKKSFLQSLKTALIAKREAKRMEDYYYWGLIGYNIFDIFTETHMLSESLAIAEETIEAFKKAGKEEHLDWAYYYKAKALCNLDSVSQSRAVLDSLCKIAQFKESQGLINSCYKLYIKLCARSENKATYDSIPYYFHIVKNPSASDHVDLIQYYENVNQLDSAKFYLDKIFTNKTKYNDISLEYVNAKYEFKIGEKDKAFDRLNKTLAEFNALYHSFSQMGLAAYQADFYQEEARIAEEESGKAKNIAVFIIVIIIIIATLYVFYYKTQIKRKEEELSLSLDIAANLRREIINNKQSSAELKIKIVQLMNSQLDTLTSLCETYYKMKGGNNGDGETNIIRKVHEIVKEFNAPEKLNEIQEIINQEQNGVLVKLFNDAANNRIIFSSRERSLLIFIISGFPATTTSILLEITLSNYYTLKSRLKNKIQAIDSVAAKEVFENYF